MKIQTKICSLENREAELKIELHRIRREIERLKEEEKRKENENENENDEK